MQDTTNRPVPTRNADVEEQDKRNADSAQRERAARARRDKIRAAVATYREAIKDTERETAATKREIAKYREDAAADLLELQKQFTDAKQKQRDAETELAAWRKLTATT